MKKKHIVSIIIPIGLITIGLILLGIVFDKEEFEKQQGLTNFYDVSSDGTVAFVYYVDGQPGIYFSNHNTNPKQPILRLTIDQEIVDVQFSPDGTKLAYIISHKDKREELKSSIHVIDIETEVDKELVGAETLITDIEYDPKNPDFIYYLKAGTFQSYSSIASARPHDFDVFHYQISTDETKQYTDLKKYMMRSLRVSSKENVVFVGMNDDANAETAEDIFASHQRIFKIPLDGSDAYDVVSRKDSDVDIYDFTLLPNDQKFIFQAVGDTGGDGIFQYELFSYDRQKKEEKQLTYIKEHTSNPVIGPDAKKVYFMVDKQFGQRNPDYHLYKMNLDGSNIEKVPLNNE